MSQTTLPCYHTLKDGYRQEEKLLFFTFWVIKSKIIYEGLKEMRDIKIKTKGNHLEQDRTRERGKRISA